MSGRQAFSAAGDDVLVCRFLFSPCRFGKHEVGKSKQERNYNLPRLMGHNCSHGKKKHLRLALTMQKEEGIKEYDWACDIKAELASHKMYPRLALSTLGFHQMHQ